jgi:zinc transporter ZupT
VHKFSDGVTLAGLFLDNGHPRGKTLALTGALSAATPLGVLLGLAGAGAVTPAALAAFLGFAAGGFLYVSAADILPRLHKSRDAWCWIFLLAGMSLSLLHR